MISLLPKPPDFCAEFCRVLSESQRLFCTAPALGLLCSPALLCCCEFCILFLSTTSSLPLLLSRIFLIPKDLRVRRISAGKMAGNHTQSLSEPLEKELQQGLLIAASIPGVQRGKAHVCRQPEQGQLDTHPALPALLPRRAIV